MNLAADLAATHGAAFDGERGWTEAEFAAFLADSAVILAGDAASFVLGRVTMDEAEILTLATAPAARRQGRARQALSLFLDLVTARGANRVFLEVAADNHAAIALYAQAGFDRVGSRRGYYRRADGSRADAFVLARQI